MLWGKGQMLGPVQRGIDEKNAVVARKWLATKIQPYGPTRSAEVRERILSAGSARKNSHPLRAHTAGKKPQVGMGGSEAFMDSKFDSAIRLA
jgi:hypothetical protein